ncbi:cysteine proteinase [Trifolium pratense]|uniref:Cysteine proteinase n=1 Tax=Trifolium pratense TaxID=57577 RepID=A0A2K3MXJ1_TRIPR|nr:cysteine proteinase [Trifolium pratense]
MFSKLSKGLKYGIPVSAALYLAAYLDAYIKHRNSHKLISWARGCNYPPDVSVINQDISDLPQAVDWRQLGAVTDVSNQGDFRTCFAFSSVEAVEGAHQIISGELVKLSAQEILDNWETDYSSGGSVQKAFDYIKQNGIGLSSDYP